ncbi:MAG TPA: SDR family oxidoreductase [Actinomycetota bacterium]|nr:SDR family oxidoreductase [Actinomycetota bacterium]
MKDKVVVITGATSGIGTETARALADIGARVVMINRNPQKAEAVADDLRRTATRKIDLVKGDMSSFASIREAANDILERYPRIDVFISNAGVFRARRHTTADGLEEVFGVNHLAPFLLTNLLLERLRASAPSRIVVVASEAHRGAVLDFDDLLLERRYGAWKSYSRSKLANIMFTYALARRLEGSDVTANCLHPGFVATRLGSGNKIPIRPVYILLRPFTKSPKQGAETSVYLASSPDVDGVSGKYFDNKRESRSSRVSLEEEPQELLWKMSADLTGIAPA